VEQGSGVALIGISDERWAYLAVPRESDLPILLERLREEEEVTAFATLESWMVPATEELGTVKSELTCIRYILPQEAVLPEVPTAAGIRQLRREDASTIAGSSEYAEYISEEYIEEAIISGFSAGVEEEGRLVAWATTHDDLAIGNLHVLPSHRRRGLAALLVTTLVRKLRGAGCLPVMNIEPRNTASRNLATRLGFREDRLVSWIKLAPQLDSYH
jgi:8-oxo-dGTP diphosphatase